MSEIQKEYNKAKEEKRQPNCPHCGNPLTICTTRIDDICWEWSEHEKQYVMDGFGDVPTPYCAWCRTVDWDFQEFLND